MKIPPIFLIVLSLASTAQAATIIEDFESSSLGSGTPPTGWTFIQSSFDITSGGASYTTTTGNAGAGLGGHVTGLSSNRWISAGYAVSTATFDIRDHFSGTFNFMVEGGSAANYKNLQFMFGDIQSDLGNTNTGQFITAHLERNTFGNRALITDGTQTFLTAANRIDAGNWYTATITWTNTGGTTGDFTLAVSGAHNWSVTAGGYTFDSPEAALGFGVGGYATNVGDSNVDNINFTGTAYVVPEPRIPMLFGSLGMLLLLRRRRH